MGDDLDEIDDDLDETDDDFEEFIDDRIRAFDQLAAHPDFIGEQLEKVHEYLVGQEELPVEDQFPQVRILRYHLECLVRELSIEQPNPMKAVSHAFALGRLFLIEDYRELHKSAESRAAGKMGGRPPKFSEKDKRLWGELDLQCEREGVSPRKRVGWIQEQLQARGRKVPSRQILKAALAYQKRE